MGRIGKTFDLDDMDYEDLRNLEYSIEKEMDEFFDEDEVPYYGDRYYQDLCEDLEEVREAIEKKIEK